INNNIINTKNTFSGQERLKSRKKLQAVFKTGKRVYSGQIKLLFIEERGEQGTVQCGVGANSRYFKKAVDRNRIKRLLREAYRLQQHPLKAAVQQRQSNICLFLLFTGKELPAFDEIYKQVGKGLQKIITTTSERIS
ncbi:MAG: ribonuclease P protein component, partial [Niabella sp.]|nr:ribonuclease P protein component [Niabella sp.]